MNPSKFYVLDARGGQAYVSTDGGAHFTASPTGLPNLPEYQFSSASAQATPGIEGDVWLTNFKELNHSTNSGKSGLSGAFLSIIWTAVTTFVFTPQQM